MIRNFALTFALFGLALSAPTLEARAQHMEHGGRGHKTSVGRPGDPNKVARSIEVIMSDDMRFTPAQIEVKRGETVRFALKNVGKLTHEMVIASAAELKEHAEMMRAMPAMEHDEPNEVTVAPGKTASLVWQFTRAGAVEFACLQPGHFEAGMKGKVLVK